MKKIVFVGGGTAGHVYPTLAVARALRKALPQAEFYYAISKDGPEDQLIDWQDFTKLEIKAARTPLKKSAYPAFIFKNLWGIVAAIRVLKKLQPDLVFAGGGFVSAPLLAAAKVLGIPFYMHEQNAIPGRVTKLFARGAEQVFASFPPTASSFPAGSKVKYSGNPVREEFFTRSRADARASLELSEAESLLLVLGGSLGAKALNDCIAELGKSDLWQEFKQKYPKFRIKLVSGLVNSRIFKAEFSDDEAISAANYLDTRLWLPAADLVLGRAGASILMELAATAKPAIIVPFPEAANAHQDANAAIFKEQNAAVVLAQDNLSPERLLREVDEILSKEKRSEELSRNIQQLAKPKAADEIVSVLLRNL